MDYVSLSMANVALDSAHSMSCLSISIMNDLIYEDTEFFTISLSDMDPKRSALTLSPDTYTISITNDDGEHSAIYAYIPVLLLKSIL